MPSLKELVIKEQGISHKANQRDGQERENQILCLWLSAFTTASYLPYSPAPVVKGGVLGDTLSSSTQHEKILG